MNNWMIAQKENRKQLIDFLIQRWKLLTIFATSERVHVASCRFAKEEGLPPPKSLSSMIPMACLQIEIIKQRIIEILPEASFIDYNYNAQAPLEPHDFAELYMDDHYQCMGKVEDLMERMKML